MNTQALDALASLCGSAAATSGNNNNNMKAMNLPAPPTSTSPTLTSSSSALVARRLQSIHDARVSAAAVTASVQLEQAQAAVSRHVALSHASDATAQPPLDLLRAYLARTNNGAVEQPPQPQPTQMIQMQNHHQQVGSVVPFPRLPTLRGTSPPVDPNAEGRALAMSIMAQRELQMLQQKLHRVQQQQQFMLPSSAPHGNRAGPAAIPSMATQQLMAHHHRQIQVPRVSQAPAFQQYANHPSTVVSSSASGPLSFEPSTSPPAVQPPTPTVVVVPTFSSNVATNHHQLPARKRTVSESETQVVSQVIAAVEHQHVQQRRRVPLKKRIICTADGKSKEGGNPVAAGGGKKKFKKSQNATTTTVKSVMSEWEEKKEAKRAANRLSATLSRKRKKLFIEDLKYENQELRRKNQILQSIPDWIIVFDTSGTITFVSDSVLRFFDYTNSEEEGMLGMNFYDLLAQEECEEVVKGAFMDAVASSERHQGDEVGDAEKEDSTPLFNGGSLSVKLGSSHVDDATDEGDYIKVSLKGVVHFTGEGPECVCSIRPEEATTAALASSSSGSISSSGSSSKNVSRSNTTLSSSSGSSVEQETGQEQAQQGPAHAAEEENDEGDGGSTTLFHHISDVDGEMP